MRKPDLTYSVDGAFARHRLGPENMGEMFRFVFRKLHSTK